MDDGLLAFYFVMFVIVLMFIIGIGAMLYDDSQNRKMLLKAFEEIKFKD